MVLGRAGPGIPEERLEGPRFQENPVDVVEVGEVGVDLQDPVRLDQQHGGDVEQGDAAREERPVLHPCDDIMQTPGDVEADRRAG